MSPLERYEELRPSLQTGDLVLFSGKSVFSTLIKKLHHSDWSHVGMVVKMPGAYDLTLLWEATTLLDIEDFDTGTFEKSVKLVPLSERIKTYIGDISLRLLDTERDDAMYESLFKFRREMRGRPYQGLDLELIKAVYDGPGGLNEEDFSTVFCSELIAEAYERMGLLHPKKPANEYTPFDFSSKQKNTEEFPLIRGSLSDEIIVKRADEVRSQ